MKKLVSLVLTLCLALSCTAFVLADEAAYQPGTYEAYGDGFMDAVKLTLGGEHQQNTRAYIRKLTTDAALFTVLSECYHTEK